MYGQHDASLAEILEICVSRCGYTLGQLAQLTGLPKRTIANWLSGIVARPRDWRGLVKLAAVLHLDEVDTTRLLQAAQQPGVDQLLAQLNNDIDRDLLAPWVEIIQHRLEQSPFQAVADLPHFVGRECEIEAIKLALLDPESNRLCSLHGMAGAGKTALATHLAYQLRAYFPDGVLWARVDQANPMSILSSFARAYQIDVTEYKDVENRSRVVRELLAPKRTLIVLDNVETSEQVEPLLPPSGNCAVLLTSRRHDLAVTRGTRRIEVGPFTQLEESLDLFAKLLGNEQAQREHEALMEIADLLGHLPLALDIAASRIAYEPGWSAAGFLIRLRRERSRLCELVFDNQSVRLSFNISYKMISPECQCVFHELGVLGGEDFSLETAAHVSDLEQETAADHLRSLYALSLVQLSRSNRYRLHPLLRDLALEGEPRNDALGRMVAFFVRYAEAHRESHDALELEISNLLVALQSAFEHGLYPDVIRGTGALSNYLEVSGLYSQAIVHLGQAVQAAEIMGNEAAQASLLAQLGLVLIHDGQLAAAEQHLLQGLHITQQTEALQETATLILGYLGLAAYYRNDYEGMEQYLLAALKLARALHQNETICQLLEGLSQVAQRYGDYAQAEAYCREGVALAHQLERPDLISLRLKDLGHALFERGGNYAEISAYMQESLSLAREFGHPRLLCSSLLSLGYVTCEHGDYELAETYLQEALELMQHTDFPVERIFVLCTLGLTASGRNMIDQAAEYLREGLALSRQAGMVVLIAPIQNAWGWLYFKQQAWDAATIAFTEALEIAQQTGFRLQIAQALGGLAHVAAACGDLTAARKNGRASLVILDAIEHRTRVAFRDWLSQIG